MQFCYNYFTSTQPNVKHISMLNGANSRAFQFCQKVVSLSEPICGCHGFVILIVMSMIPKSTYFKGPVHIFRK